MFAGLSFGVFCANFGFLAAYTFIPLHALKMGATMAEVGFLLATYSVISTIMMLTLGRISDIGGLRRILIVLGFTGSATVYWLLGLSSNYFHLLSFWAILGVTDSAYRPAVVAVIAEISSPLKIGRSLGIFNAFIAAGMASGCLAGGKIADLFGFQLVFIAASLMLVLATGFSLVLLKNKDRVMSDTRTSAETRKMIELGMTRSRFLVSSGLLLLCFDVFLRNSGFRGVTTFLPIYLTGLGAENTLTGMIIAVNFASQVPFMPIMGWLSDAVGRKHVLSIGMLATVSTTFLLSVVNNPLDVIPIQIAVGFSWAAITVASNAFAADIAPAGRLGETVGTVQTSMNLGGVVGPIAAGVISDRVDLRTTFQILTLFPFLGFLFSMRMGIKSSRPVRH